MGPLLKHEIALLLRDGFFSTVLSLFTCFLLSLLFFNTSFFNPLSEALEDFSFLDVYYTQRLEQNHKIAADIVLVNVEHNNRKELGQLMQRIVRSEPKVVGFDIILKAFEKTPADTLLARVLNEKNVVSAYIVQSDTSTITNHPFFIKDSDSGFVNFNFDSKNSVIREFNGLTSVQGNEEMSFPAVIAKKYLSKEVWKSRRIADKIVKSRVINYQGGLDHYLHLTADEVMNLETGDLLKDKVVLIGYLGSPTSNPFDIEDKHFTPLNEVPSGKSIPDMYGLVIHANILAMLLSDTFMYKITPFWFYFLMVLFSFAASVYFIWLDTRLKLSYRTVRKAILFVFSVLFIWVTLLLFIQGIVLKSAPIIAVTVFSAGFVKYYKHLVLYLKTKINFQSYIT